jgi:hypothetical protein
VKYYECSDSGKRCSGILFISESKFAVPIALTGYDCATGECTQNSLRFHIYARVGRCTETSTEETLIAETICV